MSATSHLTPSVVVQQSAYVDELTGVVFVNETITGYDFNLGNVGLS